MAKPESLTSILGSDTQWFVNSLREHYGYLILDAEIAALLVHTPQDIALWALSDPGGIRVPKDLRAIESADFDQILTVFLSVLGDMERGVLLSELAENGWIPENRVTF